MVAKSSMCDATGDLFETNSVVAHRYRVIGYRGDRGFGQVYEAHDSAMDQRVALIRLSREFSRPDTRESFYETRSTAAVEDPRIVDLCDYGEDVDGRLFLVTPWVEQAETLEELLVREGALPWPRVRAIVEQIAGALEAAHQKGVLHGGLEPRRVLIDRADGIHIVDFGLAPALTQSAGRETTLTGPLPGKIEYLSPEQVRGEAVDARSDIYALGVILWELIAGAPPFSGDSVAVADAHLGAPLPELQRRGPNTAGPKHAWAPAEIEPLLHLALAKDPGERLSSASEFSSLLAAIPGSEPQPMLARPLDTARSSGRDGLHHGLPGPTPKRATPPAAKPPPPPTTVPSGAIGVAPVREPVTSVPEPSPSPPPEPSVVAPEPSPSPPPEPSVVAPGVPRAIEPPPEVEPAPLHKRRFGKLELAILVFLGFDVLLFAGWKLFSNSIAATSEPDDTTVASDKPRPESAPEPPPAAPTKAEQPEPADPEPSDSELGSQLSAEEAIAAALPPEPDTPGPVRPMSKSLSDKAFRKAMVAARSSMLDKCLDSRMRRTLKVALKVAPNGQVEYARVVGSLGDTTLGQCIVKQVYKIEFPLTYEGGSHTYTLRLR